VYGKKKLWMNLYIMIFLSMQKQRGNKKDYNTIIYNNRLKIKTINQFELLNFYLSWW